MRSIKNLPVKPVISSSGNLLTDEHQIAAIPPVRVSTLQKVSYKCMSVVPVKLAIATNNLISGSPLEKEIYKKFSTEVLSSLNITGSSPQFLAHLIAEYLTVILKSKMHLGELLTFINQIDYDLNQAYNAAIPENRRNLHKIRAFKTIMLKLGPHGLKHIQSMRPKNSNSWIYESILTAQSDLPALPVETVAGMLKDAFRTQGTLEYVEHFSEHFEVVKVLGAGTVGIAALVKFRETPHTKEKELVVKIIRPGTVQNFLKDNAYLNQAIEILLTEKKATLQEANSFRNFSEKKLAEELREANPNLENAHLLEVPYQGKNVTTVHGHLDLAGKSSNVVFMEKAEGVELGKYLKKARLLLANPNIPAGEKELQLEQLFFLRRHYAELAKIHVQRINANQTIHADPHSGNIFYDLESNRLSVLDLGAVVRPISKALHLQMRQFIFYIYLSAGTADAHYLRMYYEMYKHGPDGTTKIDPVQIDKMIAQIQKKLADIKEKNRESSVIDAEKATNEVVNIITNTALSENPDVIPSALVSYSRSNQLIAEELTELRQDLAESKFATKIPYCERTTLGIAIKSAIKKQREKNAELWTPATWKYFTQHTVSLRNGKSEWQFEKKFIYGIFGLTEWEATRADILIPGAVVGSAIIIPLGTRALYRGLKKAAAQLPDFRMSYKLLQSMREAGFSRQELFTKIKSIFPKSKFLQEKWEAMKEYKASVNQRMKSSTSHLQTNFFKAKPILPKPLPITPLRSSSFLASKNKVVMGMIVGGAITYGALQLYKKP